MKYNKFIYIGIITILSCVLLFSSCKDEDKTFPSDKYFVYFEKGLSLGLEGTTIEVPVTLVSTLNPNAVTITIALEDSTAIAGTDYQLIGDGTVTFPPNELVAYVSIALNDNATLCEEDKFIKLKILSISEPNVHVGFPSNGNKSSHLINMQDDDIAVIEDISGSYSVITTGGTGDGAGGILDVLDPYPWDYTVSITADGSTNRYILDDITMGLYTLGYGDDPNPGTFDYEPSTRQITIDEAASPDVVYGGDAFFGTGSVSLDCDGNFEFITISWSNSWGDTGISTLNGL